MGEEGLDISSNIAKRVFDFYKAGKIYNYVITICDQETAQRCRVFPCMTKRHHWTFENPCTFTGSLEDKLSKSHKVRDEIKAKVLEFIKSLS
jgi:arsenate reductase